MIAASFLLFCAASAHAQNPLPLGMITKIVNNAPCTVNGSNPLMEPSTTCYALTVDCSNVDSKLMPLVGTIAVSTPANSKGTIFLHNGSSGTAYLNGPLTPTSYAQAYYTAGYQVVQIAWALPGWQNAYNTDTTLEPLVYAACRPATVLSHVNMNFHKTGSMCAQGHSAGSGAMAYSLAMYGSYAYLDNVLLVSGPVYGDVQQGCQFPNVVSTVTLCPPGANNGCDTQSSWTDFPQYVNMPSGGTAEAVAKYTIPNVPPAVPANCNNWQASGTMTSSTQNMEWKTMSITNSIAVYYYPNTTIRAFLCGPISDSDDMQNNSAAQGWLFYQNFILPNNGMAKSLLVHRIDDCNGTEDITSGIDNGEGGQSGFVVAMNDMTTLCVNNHGSR